MTNDERRQRRALRWHELDVGVKVRWPWLWWAGRILLWAWAAVVLLVALGAVVMVAG